MFLRGTTLLGCFEVSLAVTMPCQLQLCSVRELCYEVTYNTALFRASFPVSLISFLFHCSYYGFPTSYLLVYMHLFSSYTFLFSTDAPIYKTTWCQSHIIILLNTTTKISKVQDSCPCAYLSTMPWRHMGEWRINSTILKFNTKWEWSASCPGLCYSLNRDSAGLLSGLDHLEKTKIGPRFPSSSLQPSCYTDWTI